MAAERESNRTLYGSEVKGKVRKEIIANAVYSLTKGRSTSACVKRDYPGDLLKQLQANATLSPERIQSLEKSLERWKKIHDSNIQEKEAHQLKVCFLAGDDPTKDLDVFLGHNVLDTNIWMVEKNHSVYSTAIKALQDSPRQDDYRRVKFWKVDVMDFFKSNHNRFDIIYIDSCSSLPAKHTLKVIASIFELDKLESPGALITTFSFPPKEHSESVEQKQITFVANEYLQYKLERTLRQNPEQIYGDYITHQVIDLASLLVPASHILLPTNWKAILIRNIKTFFEEVHKHLANSDDDDDVDSDDMKAIVNDFYLTKICRAMKKEKEIKVNPQCTAWLRDVFPRSKGPSEDRDICELLQTTLLFSSFIFFSKFANSETLEFLDFARRDEDKKLMAWIVLGHLAEPSYPVLDKLLRLKYTQSEETCKRQMFCDVFIFDRCRYLFDLPPTVNIAGQFCNDDDNDFLMSKMLLNGMRRQLKCLCKTGILQIDFRHQFGLSESDGCDEELCTCLPERKTVK